MAGLIRREGAIASILERLAADEILLLDGAVGTEIQRRGAPMSGVDWAATAIDSHPNVVRAVHEDYIRAGADIITANTFSTRRDLLEPSGKGGRAHEINIKAVALAREARERVDVDRPIWIAGSIWPKGRFEGGDGASSGPDRMRTIYEEQAAARAGPAASCYTRPIRQACSIEE